MQPLPEIQSPPPGVSHPVDASFIGHILRPYVNKNCVYLKTAEHVFGQPWGSTRATFSIPESCYIDSTGHFNAVELNICLNQMYYVMWADGIRRGAIPEAAGWNMDEFKTRQLPGMLIVRVESEFKKAIDRRSFRGEGQIENIGWRSDRDA